MRGTKEGGEVLCGGRVLDRPGILSSRRSCEPRTIGILFSRRPSAESFTRMTYRTLEEAIQCRTPFLKAYRRPYLPCIFGIARPFSPRGATAAFATDIGIFRGGNRCIRWRENHRGRRESGVLRLEGIHAALPANHHDQLGC